MKKIIVALLIVASFLIPGAIADPAQHYSGECDIDICSGQLDVDSDYPEKALTHKEKSPGFSMHAVITPSGQFTWTIHIVETNGP